jgi:Pyruvate/2-oxoacid:ferredoxin oxidoreductase gamma subunit
VQPYSVNAQMAEYPDINSFAKYLGEQCKEVVFIEKFPEGIDAVLFNVFLLGRATRMKDFPFEANKIEEAIINTVTAYHKEKTVKAFKLGVEFELKKQSA